MLSLKYGVKAFPCSLGTESNVVTKIFMHSMLILILVFGLNGCVTTASLSSSSKGVIVDVYEKAREATGSMHCEGDGEEQGSGYTMDYIYVGEGSITGNIKSAEKKKIAMHAKSALNDTHFIKVALSEYEDGYGNKNKKYPALNIDIDKFIVESFTGVKLVNDEERGREGDAAKYGVFSAQYSINMMGSKNRAVCTTSAPITEEDIYYMPSHKKDQLPSRDEIIEKLVKEATRKAIATFVPLRKTILRQLEPGDGVIGQSIEMIDHENCAMAKNLLSEYIAQNKEDAKAMYTLGVAYECMAKGRGIQEAKEYLFRSWAQYKKAADKNRSNTLYNQAAQQLEYETSILATVQEKSKSFKQYMEE